MATISKENYLKTIFFESEKNGKAISTSLLANELNVSNAAITEMANKLSAQGYVSYEKYKGIKILSKGRKVALDVIRKHRLWETFLTKVLDLKWSEVHKEADNLEHSTTEFLVDKIDEFLNYPKIDPHGEPIPNKNGTYREEADDIVMYECELNEIYKVVRVSDKSSELMDYLSKINISLNKPIKIIDKLKFDNSVIIEVDNVRHSLSEIVVKSIYVAKIK